MQSPGKATLLTHPQKIISELGEAVRQAFGVDISSLEYLPVGFVGAHFLASDPEGRRYFLTVYDGSRLAQISARRLPFTLAVIHHLQQSGQFTNLVVPLLTRQGKYWAEHDGRPVIVYPYVEGHLLAEEGASDEIRGELGRLVAQLHQAKMGPGIINPIREEFNFHFEAPLRQSLARLDTEVENMDRGRKALRNLILPHRGKIHDLLLSLHELAARVQRISPPFVICHTDLHPWNIIRTVDRKLVVIDWEGVCLAPAEYDLFMFAGHGFETFLMAYYEAGGRRNLSAEGFAYYFYRRNLEDLTDFILRILDEHGGDERDRKDLEGMQQDCLADWPYLETAVERMKGVLDEI
jgi:spectinomycin phosphotransferase